MTKRWFAVGLQSYELYQFSINGFSKIAHPSGQPISPYSLQYKACSILKYS